MSSAGIGRSSDGRGSARRLRTVAAIAATAAAIAVLAGQARGHGLEPALLALHETSPGVFEVVWKSASQRLPGANVQPTLPAICRATSPIEVEDGGDRVRLRWSIDCGPEGLAGREVGVADLDVAKITALVRVQSIDGTMHQGVLNESQPSWRLPARVSPLASAGSFLRLGFRHALSGPDHVILIAALLLLSPDARGLPGLLASFALGEGIALAPAMLGAPVLPAHPAALLVAACLLALATILARRMRDEAPRKRRTGRFVALVSGLVQGASFAGALGAASLPTVEAPFEWLGFQAGLSLAQALVATLLLVLGLRLAGPLARVPRVRRAAIWGLGVLAAFWCFERISPWVG